MGAICLDIHHVVDEIDGTWDQAKAQQSNAGIDPDLQKVYQFINEEIQDLQKENFENEYQHIRDNLSDLFEDTHQIEKKGKDNVL